MKMKNINQDERPRERLLKHGASHLSDTELLAIMLSSGTKEESVLELSSRLVNTYGLKRLLDMSLRELLEIKGIGYAKASILKSSFEIARRTLYLKESIKIKSVQAFFEYIKSYFFLEIVEKFIILYTDSAGNILSKQEFTSNSPIRSSISYKDIAKEALNCHAVFAFVAHNHPSGDMKASKADIALTQCLFDFLASIEVHLFAHIIIFNNNYETIPIIQV